MTHVDDLMGAGNQRYNDTARQQLRNAVRISHIEKSDFMFLGVHVQQAEDSIWISQEDYLEKLTSKNWVMKDMRPQEILKMHQQVLGSILPAHFPVVLPTVQCRLGGGGGGRCGIKWTVEWNKLHLMESSYVAVL